MEDQVREVIESVGQTSDQFQKQLSQLRAFRDKMQAAGLVPEQKQFAVPKITLSPLQQSIVFRR